MLAAENPRVARAKATRARRPALIQNGTLVTMGRKLGSCGPAFASRPAAARRSHPRSSRRQARRWSMLPGFVQAQAHVHLCQTRRWPARAAPT